MKPLRAPALLLILGLILTVGSAPAQEPPPLVTDRPDFTESAVTVPVSRVQVEAGYTFTRAGSAHRHALGEALWRIGLAQWAELRLGLNSFVVSREPGESNREGLEDPTLGIKLALADGAQGWMPGSPTVALILAGALPSGGRAYRGDRIQPEAKLSLAWTLTERASLGSNLNAAWLREEGDSFLELSGSVSLGYALTDPLGSYVEVYGFEPVGTGGPAITHINGGFTYQFLTRYQLDLRAGTTMAAQPRESFIGVGIAVRW